MSSSTTATSDAMLSLMQKHANLYDLVEQCRSSTRLAQTERERLDAEIESLRNTRHTEGMASQREQERVQELQALLNGPDKDGVVSLQKQLDQIEADYAAAAEAHHHAEQANLRWKAYKQEQFQRAIDSSRNFQLYCQQWQIQVAAIEPSFITAAALRACEKETEAGALEAACADRTTIFVQDDKDSVDRNDPSTWIIPDDDYELTELVAAYNQNKSARDTAALALESCQAQESIISTQCGNSLERAQQLEMQLSRIVADCEDLTSKTAELQLLTNEDISLANAYRSKIEQRRSKTSGVIDSARHMSFDAVESRHMRRPLHVASSIPALRSVAAQRNVYTKVVVGAPQPTRNPYATKRPPTSVNIDENRTVIVGATEADTLCKRPRREELASIVLGPSALARRSHRDRRFGCSVEIPDGAAIDETRDEVVTQTANTEESLSYRPIDLAEDDDTDELLSYVAFAKRDVLSSVFSPKK